MRGRPDQERGCVWGGEGRWSAESRRGPATWQLTPAPGSGDSVTQPKRDRAFTWGGEGGHDEDKVVS